MKYSCFTIALLFSLFTISCNPSEKAAENSSAEKTTVTSPDRLLRHVVLFKWKAAAPPAKIKEIENAFSALPDKIAQIADYEWGINNSPEGLNKGLTHCFLVTFNSEEDRAVYLPHPDHQAFVKLIGEYVDDVTVVDYWTE